MPTTTHPKTLDTVIVGGGIAGLTIAYRLQNQDILLLEKEDYCGGRTLSKQMGEYVYNMGAQVVNGDDSLVAPLANELGVTRSLINKTKLPIIMKGKLVTASNEPSFLWQLPISLTDKIKLGWRVLNLRRKYGEVRKDFPDINDPDIIHLNSMTLAQYMNLENGDLRDIWDTVALATTTTHAGESSAYHPISTFLHFMAKEYFVNGGTWQITRALWDRLSDRIETSAEVARVEQGSDSVTVTFSQGGRTHTVRARKCVMAVPAPVALPIIDPLPDWKREALAAARYGSITSAGFLLDRNSEDFLGKGVWRVPTVRSRLVSVTNPTITFPQEVKDRTGQGLLRVYTADAESKRLSKLSDGESLESLMEDLYAVLPNTRGHVITGALKHWEHGGSPWLVGRLAHVPNIQAPTDNIHYAGDYTAGSGMDAAVHSASRVLTELGHGPLFPTPT